MIPKIDKGIHYVTVEKINYIVGYNDIKAGDIFMPEDAMEELFAFTQM
ncbi:hypothetical protein KQI85_12940 [Falcatimonas sp. MSJ-15]|nr:hypothetical protein [Falcatimonas sp. MSJ-15]MBU5471264.1 hypothetical protein [Falcatimonas sp. MSJ-15]